MRATLAVATREIVDRKLLFLGAFVTGLLPLTFPLIPVLRHNSRDARSLAVLLGAAIVAVALSIAFGATVLVGDITQKRLAFYLSRPLSSLSIWAGKILGAFSIAASCVVLTVLPDFLVEGASAFSLQTGGLGPRRLFLFTFIGTLLFILLSHVVTSMARLRSAWVVPDFLLAMAFTIWIFSTLHGLTQVGLWDLSGLHFGPDWFALWIAAPLIAVLLGASYVQIADGRSDTRRSHGALSATLWGALLLIALPLTGLSWWVNAATPSDLASVLDVRTAPRGPWMRVLGDLHARGSAQGSFLYDTSSGRFIKRQSKESWNDVTFSAEGSGAAWAGERFGFLERKKESDIFVADLLRATATSSGLSCERECRVALSPSGRTLAVFDGNTVSAYDVSSPSNPRQVGAFRVDAGRRVVQFVDEDRMRLFPFDLREARGHAPASLEIEELSLSSKKSLVTGHVDAGPFAHLRLSADGRFLVGTDNKRGLTLLDGRTGAIVATLSDELSAPTMRFLSGNRMVVAAIANGKAVLKVFLEGGRAAALVIELGPAASLVLGGEIAPGRVAVSLNPFRSNDERSRRAWKLGFVNVATRAVSSGPDGLVPLDRLSWWFSPTLPPAEAGLPSSLLFLDADNRLVRLDSATGVETVLLGRSK